MTNKGAQWLAGLAGGLWGFGVGLVAAVLLVVLSCGGNPMMTGLGLIFALPVGVVGGTLCGVRGALRLLPFALPFGFANRPLMRAACVVAGVPFALCAGFYLPFNPFIPPSDQALIAEFNRSEAALNQLVSMIQHDKNVQIVALEWTRPDNPQAIKVTPARIANYRVLLRRASLFSVSIFPQDGMIRFPKWINGGGPASENVKGFAYLPHPPQKTHATLDGERQEASAYRHIKGNWYLFYQFIQ